MARGKRKRLRYLDRLQGQECPACGDYFETVQGLMAHMSNAKGCAWYRKGKRRAIFDLREVDAGSEDELDTIEAPGSEIDPCLSCTSSR